MTRYISHNETETENFGSRLAKNLHGSETIALFGGLGAGKTALTRGIAHALGCGDCVSSPTFAIVHEYSGRCKLFHFDMYRIETIDDLYSTGFFEYLGTGVTVIEWSENIENVLPDNCLRIEIKHSSTPDERIFELSEDIEL
ncbi:MAG: tRNA (adenosine(37)-N6)-threonylcarbamoyltransferase complex ATPase subunit type 1 TsaE [Oscillospiraceae bacterium]|jgi:tRNA threonylcarbamoyladenosine biosynthesis protein TsaE|nr:tRNA (adenosine(37)-N6)-threonylcarbamoyltransferase complex ATPase subunit type 1 TsaE [Oscillospiraceae bacterium]